MTEIRQQQDSLSYLTFSGVALQRSGDKVPMLIGYENDWKDPNIRQTVTFESCLFEDLDFGSKFIPDSAVLDDKLRFNYGRNYSEFSVMILATDPSNTVILRDCTFRNGNDNVGRAVRALLVTEQNGLSHLSSLTHCLLRYPETNSRLSGGFLRGKSCN